MDPLPPHCIRVLEVFPLSGDLRGDETRIIGRLHVVELATGPTFAALSYVWGPFAQGLHYITCDGIQLQVTASCHSAITHLRRRDDSIYLWVDAICINQRDSVEKAQQIPLMGDIYSAADRVYVWLGEGNDSTERAMKYLRGSGYQRLVASSNGNGKDVSFPSPYAAAWELYFARWNPHSHPVPYDTPKFTARHLCATVWWPSRKTPFFKSCYVTHGDLLEVLGRAWNTRLWTYQEILLSRNPIVVCGNEHVSWSNFERSLLFLESLNVFGVGQVTRPWTSASLARERLQKASQRPDPCDLESYRSFISRVAKAHHKLYQIRAIIWVVSLVAMITAVAIVQSVKELTPPRRKGLLSIIGLLGCIVLYGLISNMPYPSRRSSTVTVLDRFLDNESLAIGLYSRNATEPKDMAYGMWAVLQAGGSVNLPTPDYSLDIGLIYHVFTVELARATQSLDLLLLAAAKGISGQPSWVPDWSAHKRHVWKDSIVTPVFVDNCGNTMLDHPLLPPLELRKRAAGHLNMEAETPAQFHFDENCRVIIARAKRFCQVESIFRFRAVDDGTDNPEDVHLENVRLLLQCISWEPRQLVRYDRGAFQTTVETPEFPENLTAALGLQFANVTAQLADSSGSLKSWAMILKRHLGSDARSILGLIRKDPQHLKVHEAFIRVLATCSKMLFTANKPEDPHRYFVGAPPKTILGSCSLGVQPGDDIVRFQSVPQLLIVRPLSETPTRSVTLLSPCSIQVINHPGIQLWADPPELQLPLHDTFVDYRVH